MTRMNTTAGQKFLSVGVRNHMDVLAGIYVRPHQQALKALRRLLGQLDKVKYRGDHVCARCGTDVDVNYGLVWEDGDWCYACWIAWAEKVGRQLRKLFKGSERVRPLHSAKPRRSKKAEAREARDKRHREAIQRLRTLPRNYGP